MPLGTMIEIVASNLDKELTVLDISFAMYGFWGGVIVIGIVHRLFLHFWVHRCSSSASERSASDPVSTAYLWLRKHFLVRSLVPPYHRRALLWCTIPTRSKAFVVFAYWAISIILCSVNYRAFEGNLRFGPP